MAPEIRSVTREELPAWFAAFATAFYIWRNDPQGMADFRGPRMDLERTLGAFEDGAIVGTYRSFPTRLTVPGGARVDASAVSAVSVRPTHRRRGLLTGMIDRDIRASAARGEVVSVLIAAEWPIYGRFGFGPATWQAKWTLSSRGATFLRAAEGRVEVVDLATARALIPAIYAAYAAGQPGEIDRRDDRWDVELGVVEAPGQPRWKGQYVIHRDAAGEPDGYARFHGEEVWVDMRPEHRLLLDELHGVTEAADIDLWRHLAQMDLTASIAAEVRRQREPMQWALADARVAQVSGRADFLWLRLLDVERALEARRYERDGALVIEVVDVLGGSDGPAAGRYRLDVRQGVATCARTDASPDLTLDARLLGAAYLGGTSLREVAIGGGAVEHRAGALSEAEGLFLTAAQPWCSTWF
jgi:predicted acetyltransferase